MRRDAISRSKQPKGAKTQPPYKDRGSVGRRAGRMECLAKLIKLQKGL